MKKYCEECGKEVETKVIIKKETYDVCGEPIEVDAQVLVCAKCGKEFYCEEFDNATFINAYNEYRRKRKLLLPEEIKEICAECGEEFYCEKFDNATLINAFNEYRRKHKLLLPEEIKEIREQYGLIQGSEACCEKEIFHISD